MSEKHGIDNILKVVMLGGELSNVSVRIAEGSGVGRFLAVGDLLDEGMAVATIDWKELYEEYKDWSPEERKVVAQKFGEKFDIPNDQDEAFVEEAFQLALDAESVVKRGVLLGKKIASVTRTAPPTA